jgi:hypothetical protein
MFKRVSGIGSCAKKRTTEPWANLCGEELAKCAGQHLYY